jgi:hypothetical protein
MTKNSLIVALMLATAGCDSGTSGFAGVYTATFNGTYANTTPNTASGPYRDSATITVTDRPNGRIELRWQDGADPPSEAIVFALSGPTGTAVQVADAAGIRYTSTLDNGNVQINLCEQCSITFSEGNLTQQQSGTYVGTTRLNNTYEGNYSGAWIGTKTSTSLK